MISKIHVMRFLFVASLLVFSGLCPDHARAAGFDQPAGIYINWAAYDEMSDTVQLDEALAMRQLEAMIRLRKLGVRLDYYVMDCNWFEPASGYRQWRKASWPQGPDRWLKACRDNGIKPGLWLSSNTLFGKMTPPPAWRDSHDVQAKSFSMYEGGFLEDFTNVMQSWVDQGVELFKFDFVNYWAATTNSSGLAIEERRFRNRAVFHQALLSFRQRNPQVRTLAYNGFIDIPLKPTLPELRKWPVPRMFLDQLLDVFDGIYCGDPAFADVPTFNIWRSKDIYSDHQVRNWEFVGVPLDRIDSSAFMVGTTGTCYARRTAGWKAMLLLSLARGGLANTYYGDLNLISDEDARWFAKAQSIYFPLQAKRAMTSFGAVPAAVEPYGFLAREEGGALATVVNPSQRFATLKLPVPGRGRLLFADAGFTPQVQDGSVTLGPEQMAVIGFGTYAEARYELGRDTDSKIPVEIEPVQTKFVPTGSNSVTTTIPGVPAGKAVRILWQQFDPQGVPKRSLVFGNKLSAGKVFLIQAEQEGRPVPVQVDYDKPIWSGLSWAAGEIRSQDLAPGKPLKLTCTSLDPKAVEIRVQVYTVSERSDPVMAEVEAIPASLPIEFSRPASPFLMLTAQEIPGLRSRVQKLPWARESANQIRKQAEEILKSPNIFPDQEAGYGHWFACSKCGGRLRYDKRNPHKYHCEKCNLDVEGTKLDEGYRYCSMMEAPREQRTLAAAYLVTGEKRYAEGLAANFRDIAAKYARFRLHDNAMRFDPERVAARTWCGGRAHSQWIDECNMLTAMLPSYDVLLGSGVLTAEDQKQIEAGLWKNALDYMHLIMGKRGSGANWDIWANSCAVMMGITFDDKKLVDEGLNSPKYGLLFMLRRGYLNQDGFISELSPGYHEYVMTALFRMFAATRRVGIPMDQIPGLQAMLDVNPAIRLPNAAFPVLGDCRHGSINPAFYEVAWNWYRKPAYAQVLAECCASADRSASIDALLYGPDELPAPAPLTDTTVLPDTMIAIQRTPLSDWHALLKCDKGIGGHRHPDALNFHLYANGEEVIPGTGAPEYTNPLLQWYRETIAHNTVTLNTRAQNQRTRNQRLAFGLSKWGCSAVEMSVEDVQRPSEKPECPARLRRLIAMTPHGIIDIFRVESAATPKEGTPVNLLDMALHLRGELALKNPLVPWATPLVSGERLKAPYDPKLKKEPHEGYKWLSEIQKVTESGPIEGRLAQPKGGKLDFWLAAGPAATDVFVAKCPGVVGAIDQKLTSVIQRRTANDTAFAGFYAPHKGQPQVDSVRFEKISGDGAEVAMVIAHKDGKDLILSRAQEGTLEAAGAKLNGVFGCVVVLPGGARQVMLVGKHWQQADVQIRLDEPRAIIVDLQPGKIRLYNASATAAKGVLQTGGNETAKPFMAPEGQSIDL
jgi:hypothetical protein